MPELPEVETICRGLRKLVLGKQIAKVEPLRPKIIKEPAAEDFSRSLTSKTIQKVERRAKYIKILLDNHDLLLVHLRMTGGFLYHQKPPQPGKHTRIIFHFSDGDALYYEDLRALGVMKLFTKNQTVPELDRLGVEPLSTGFTQTYLKKELSRSAKPIRDWLLCQDKVVGIGNIYASEILFRAKINPFDPAKSLGNGQIKLLHQHTKTVIQEAIECCGTTFSDYTRVEGSTGGFQEFLKVYQKAGSPCLTCSTVILRVKLSQRSVFFCPSCQTVKKNQAVKN